MGERGRKGEGGAGEDKIKNLGWKERWGTDRQGRPDKEREAETDRQKGLGQGGHRPRVSLTSPLLTPEDRDRAASYLRVAGAGACQGVGLSLWGAAHPHLAGQPESPGV